MTDENNSHTISTDYSWTKCNSHEDDMTYKSLVIYKRLSVNNV